MNTEAALNNPDVEEMGLDIEKSKKDIIRGIRQNFKFLKLVNPFFSCKSEDEYEEYKKQLHTLLDETITMKLAIFTRTGPKK